MLLLAGVGAAFFATRRFCPLPGRWAVAVRVLAAAPLLGSGALHLLRPAVFVPLLPPPIPPRAWIIVLTGVPELLGAAGLCVPRFRRPAAAWLAVFLLVIFPANIHIAGQTVAGLTMPGVPVRTAMQAVYMTLVLLAGWGRPVRELDASRDSRFGTSIAGNRRNP